MSKPRVIALARLRHPVTGELFVDEGVDASGRTYHRLPGGGIEFGESSAQAVVRELLEEYDLRVRVVGDPVVLENVFDLDGRPGHEIVFVCRVELADPAAADFVRSQNRDGRGVVGVWRPGGSPVPLYPAEPGEQSAFLEQVAVIVDDYDRAIEFFTGALGFDLVEDSPSLTNDGRAKRWVVVRPPGAATGLLLAQADGARQASAVGDQFAGRVGLFLRVDDFDASYEQMRADSVEFVTEPRDEPYGRIAVFLDVSGNRWDLLGPRPAGQ